jgi:hypothetical protein
MLRSTVSAEVSKAAYAIFQEGKKDQELQAVDPEVTDWKRNR